ncbi:MAG: hypothetical protein E1N59_2860 [Puniceicoccaceae bacterium 5H]|nr:MAG: hypothetical protein E1N59_2860 [Puniceicoccaceae bacterium 5H]
MSTRILQWTHESPTRLHAVDPLQPDYQLAAIHFNRDSLELIFCAQLHRSHSLQALQDKAESLYAELLELTGQRLAQKRLIDVRVPDELDTEAFHRKFAEYLAWRRRLKKKSWKRETIQRNLKSWAEFGSDAAIAAMDSAMNAEHDGVFPQRFARRIQGTRKPAPRREGF